MRRLFLLAVILLVLATPSFAAIDCDLTTLQAAVTAAARSATIICNSGSWTWTTKLTITKGITLVGSSTTITRSDTTRDCTNGSTANFQPCIVEIDPDATAIANSENISIGGFTFDAGSAITNFVQVNAVGTSAAYKNLIVQSNTFQNAKTSNVYEQGAISVVGQVRGVISGNTFNRVFTLIRVFGNNSTTDFSSGNFPQVFGSADNLYFENNTCQFSSTWAAADPCWYEIGQGGRLVYRFNNIDLTNATFSGGALGDVHGFQNWDGTPGSGQTGTMVFENYRNVTTNGDHANLWFDHRGTIGMHFDNTFSGSSTPNVIEQQYSGGCTSDINPTPTNYTPEVNSLYIFNNILNGARADMTAPNGNACGVAENNYPLGFWNQQTSFNGTVGVGRGARSARPPTCTTGVAWWSTDQGSWNQGGSGVQGVLDKCTSTNTWTNAWYTPYTYPAFQSGNASRLPITR